MSREVLAPALQRMGPNRCYRVNAIHEDFGGQPMDRRSRPEDNAKAQHGYMEQDLYAEDDDDDDESEANCYIEELPHSVFKLSMHVPQPFYGGLIGFKGSTKRRIETETNTEIFIPRSREGFAKKENDEKITIKSKKRSNVCAARRQINLIIQSLRKRTPVTHFTCTRLNYGEIKDNFIEFKKLVLAENIPSIEEALFISEARIHLTLSVFVLLDDEERAKAAELLENCRQFLKDLSTPFAIKVSGLEIMNDDPSAVRVLYARVEAPELQKFADLSESLFKRSGLLRDPSERDHIKLHMTLMNVRYLKDKDPQAANTFDARQVLKQFGEYHFGSTACSEISMCIRKTDDGNGCYKTSGSLKF